MNCTGCKLQSHLLCCDVSTRLYKLYVNNDMKVKGFKWFCSKCILNAEDNIKSNVEGNELTQKLDDMKNQIENDIGNIKSQISLISGKLQNLSITQEKLNETTTSITAAAETITKCDFTKTPSWADVASTSISNEDSILNLAKQVVNGHKKVSMDREEREKNIILFNVKEETNRNENSNCTEDENKFDKETEKTENSNGTQDENKDEPTNKDNIFFKKLCKDVLKLDEIPEFKLFRLGTKRDDYVRPIKVTFSKLWDKRKFLSRLSNLKTHDKLNHIRIAHDMSIEDRLTNKKLLEEAYQKNQSESPKDYKYKVRGPPWNMKIVKVFSKN